MDDLFFYSSKVIWNLIAPDSLFVLLLLVTTSLFYLDYNLYGRRLLAVLVVSVFLLTLFPIGSWLLHPLENRFAHNPELPEKIDGIVVLGGSIEPETSLAWQQLEINYSGERLTSFAELARRYPEAKLVFTGGNSSLSRNKPDEASILKLHLRHLGLDLKRIEFENLAKNTAENASYTKQLVNPAINSSWLLITSAFHMPRSVGVFCQTGWRLIPYPVDHQTNPNDLFKIEFNLLGHASQLNQAVHEWLGLIAYYLAGKTPKILPDGCM